ncbi:MAG: hypothetical protein KC431_03245 [Myxococcales bacterium]|nr:hypothetical protein [Myxococcales bacterium]
MSDAPDSWHGLLDELLTDDMRGSWGWSVPRSVPGRSLRAPGGDSKLSLDVGGLSVPYFCGWISVDFGARTVEFAGVDQKTPADERWEVAVGEDWWGRALAVEWPMR